MQSSSGRRSIIAHISRSCRAMYQSARADLHPRSWRRLRGRRPQLRTVLHTGLWFAGSQGHLTLGHVGGIQALHQGGT